MTTILLVDDEEAVRLTLNTILAEAEGMGSSPRQTEERRTNARSRRNSISSLWTSNCAPRMDFPQHGKSAASPNAKLYRLSSAPAAMTSRTTAYKN